MSDISSQLVARHLKQGRSAVTNGRRTLIGVNASSKYGRRYRDLFAAYSAEIGGTLSVSETAMAKQAAALDVRSEMMQAQIVNGEHVNSDDLIRICSETRRIRDAITAKARKRKPVPPSLQDHLAKRAAKRAEAVAE
jgi:hypothetical protein